jgi:hypothetical protein
MRFVELLVVVAIVPMLATLLLLALNCVKRTGHSAVCLNNIRQLCLEWADKFDSTGNNSDGAFHIIWPECYTIRDWR